METWRKAISLLTPRERRTSLALLALVMLKGLGDAVGVASVMPFLAVLGDPGLVERNAALSAAYVAFDFTSTERFATALGAVVVAFLFASAALRAATAYAINRWTAMREYTLSRKLIETYLRQPYEYFLDRHSGDLSTSILSEASRVVMEAFRPGMELISNLATLLAVVLLLLWTDPLTTMVTVAVFGGGYLLLFRALRPALRRLGEALVAANRARFRLAAEAFGGIKQIRLTGREAGYVAAFAEPSLTQARVKAAQATMVQVPRFAVEALAFGGVVALTLYLVESRGGVESAAFTKVLPILGLYAFAGYRLLPTAQALYKAAGTVRYAAPAVETVHRDLALRRSLPKLRPTPAAPLGLRRSVAFRNVSYRYPGAAAPSLEGVSVEIPRGSTVGVVGATGAGKTTFNDILLGLLRPSGGEVVVDGAPLTGATLDGWHATVGYVPQDIFLSDATVARNIAMGVPPAEITMERVERAARIARIHDHVVGALPDGYQTAIGERGVRLSGGQRQRLGIARALYHDPQLIVFDEATSALDAVTEREVMEQVDALAGDRTIVMIAHRLSTVRGCDRIIVLENGRVAEVGAYDELHKANGVFRSLALAAQ